MSAPALELSESERLDRAVREAATLVDVGERHSAAVQTAVNEHGMEHRIADVRRRLLQEGER